MRRDFGGWLWLFMVLVLAVAAPVRAAEDSPAALDNPTLLAETEDRLAVLRELQERLN